jgi:predicted HNH restriction endonuclease
MNLNTVNIELSFTIEDFEKYLSIIHPTGGTRTSYMRVLKYMNFKNIFSSYSVTEIENNFIESMKSQKFIDFINKSPSYDKKGFVKATKNKVIEFFEVLENNKSIIETDTRLDKKDFFNIHRKIEKRVINRKTIFISSRYIKEKIKANNKYFCQINDKDKCRYFLDKNTKNYIEVHHIIPLSLQEKF